MSRAREHDEAGQGTASVQRRVTGLWCGFRRSVRAFGRDVSGATTVDWVVLTAAVVGLGVAAAVSIGRGVTDHAARIEKCLDIYGQVVKNDRELDDSLARMQRRCADQ